MAAKGREKIKLVSTGRTSKNKITGTYYTTTKNKKAAAGQQKKLEKRKYDRLAYNAESGKTGLHVIFREEKIK